jgi:hypothetical protein
MGSRLPVACRNYRRTADLNHWENRMMGRDSFAAFDVMDLFILMNW